MFSLCMVCHASVAQRTRSSLKHGALSRVERRIRQHGALSLSHTRLARTAQSSDRDEPPLCANMSETTLSFSKLRARRIYMTEHAGRKPGENPEVTEKASRRRFTSEYKRRISLEAERCTQPGEIGALLRREGLYSSVVQRWRRQLREESLSSSKKSNGTPSPAQPSAAKEIASLKSENERLKERLRQAELIIDVQKKVSEMMQTRSPEKTD